MSFDAKFAYEVLLPLSSAAYSLPLKKGKMPEGYLHAGNILVDGGVVGRVDPLRKLVWRAQYGDIWLSEADKTMVVAYRGTSDFDDIVKDEDIADTNYKCVPDFGRVHAGFMKVYFSIRDSVINVCNANRAKYTRLVLTGHSLGAALSELSAVDLWCQSLPSPEVVNFAAPRVGDEEFSKKFDGLIKECYRVVNKWDSVPKVPASWTGYYHVGTAVNINAGFTFNKLKAHSLDNSYFPGMEKLLKANTK